MNLCKMEKLLKQAVDFPPGFEILHITPQQNVLVDEIMAERIRNRDARILANRNPSQSDLFTTHDKSFNQKKIKWDFRERSKRSCPGGVGSYGFNSFNFLTFALQ